VPVIVITAYSSVPVERMALRTRGAQAKAVDFIEKKDGPHALLDAIQVVLANSRSGEPKGPPVDGLRIDLAKKMVWRDAKKMNLSKDQWALLAYLYEHLDTVCSDKELITAIYYQDQPPPEVLSADVSRMQKVLKRLKEKLEAGGSVVYVINEPRRGYRLVLHQ
jgi:DNA-binding response OmpR family regulator